MRPLAEEHQIPEPYVTCASLRLSQSRPDDAKPLLEMALAIIRAADEASPPAFDARKACAKLLMEVDQAAQALELLQVLRLEHDDSLEVWYLDLLRRVASRRARPSARGGQRGVRVCTERALPAG